jgi:hypothetical protein
MESWGIPFLFLWGTAMKRRVMWQFGLAVVLLAGAGTTRAGIQVRATVCWLGTGNWQLREKEGDVYLVACRWQRSAALPEAKRHQWQVSTPTIESQSGKFLASDPKGRTPSVYLVKHKGVNTCWTFDIVANIRPRPSSESEKCKEGPSGFRFRVKMAKGPFKNWYLAAKEATAEPQESQGAATRSLKLVRDAKDATVFTYVEENYSVEHK